MPNREVIYHTALLRSKYLIIVLMILEGVASVCYSRGSELKFRHITTEQGLSQNSIFSILQDHKGFMWFGTQEGLNQYDGYQFKVHQNDPTNPFSISANGIWAMTETQSGEMWIGTQNGLNRFDRTTVRFYRFQANTGDSLSISNNYIRFIEEGEDGNLWIGTDNGLNRFDTTTQKFTQYLPNPQDASSLSYPIVCSVLKDRSGQIWVGTRGGGLNLYDPEIDGFIVYKHDPENPRSLSNNSIWCLYEDREGRLWIGTEGSGVSYRDPASGNFIHFPPEPENPHGLSHHTIRSFFEDPAGLNDGKAGNLWIGTRGGGLNYFDRQTQQFTRYQHSPENPHSLLDNRVYAIYQGKSGAFWIGTFNGLHQTSLKKPPFHLYTHNPKNPNSLSDNAVWSIHEDRGGKLWVGTFNGLNHIDLSNNRFTTLQHEPGNPNSLLDDNIISIEEDEFGDIWVGSWGGLNRLNPRTGNITHYKPEPGNPNSLRDDDIQCIYEDSQKTLWFGTENGLEKYDREADRFIHFQHQPENPNSISHNKIYAINEDLQGNLWVGTGNGLNRLDCTTGTFTRFYNDPRDSASLSNSEVSVIHVSKSGTIWIGTEKGLNRFDSSRQQFTRYGAKEDLSGNIIYGILEDDSGNLWISTNNGLFKLTLDNPENAANKSRPKQLSLRHKFQKYDTNDGLLSNEFNLGAYFKSRRGVLYFGGINSLVAFSPDSIKNNNYIPPVVITDFQIFNKSVPVEKKERMRTTLQHSISEAKKIDISYRDNVFSIEFAALNYLNSDKNQYAYKLEGFDEAWNYVGNRRFATYTNLNPGEYVFRVKGSNDDGFWNETGAALEINISSPYWKTPWFTILVILIGISLIYGAHTFRLRWLREYADRLENEVKGRTLDLSTTNQKLTAEIVERKKVAKELRGHQNRLEELVEERTKKLKTINQTLEAEIIERVRTEKALKESREQLRNHSVKLEAAREKERAWIAREIHDELGQILSGLNWDLNSLKRQLPAGQAALVKKTDYMSGLIKKVIRKIREISQELRPSILDNLGIDAAISWYVEQFQKTAGIRCRLEIDSEKETLDQINGIVVFRVLQESLTNVLRHAEATKVEISLKEECSNLTLSIKDNGKGILPEQISDPTAFGLTSMRERVYSLKGHFHISGAKSKGTSVVVTIPIAKDEVASPL